MQSTKRKTCEGKMRQNASIPSDGNLQLVLLFLGVVAIGVTEVWVEIAVEWTCAEQYQTRGRHCKYDSDVRVGKKKQRYEVQIEADRMHFPTVCANASKTRGSNRDQNEQC
jgi:hypothetical protein